MQQKKRHMMPEILHVTKIGTTIYLSMKINLKLTKNYDKQKHMHRSSHTGIDNIGTC